MKRTCRESVLSFLAFGAGVGLCIWFCIPLFWGVFHVGNGGGILFSLFLIAGSIWCTPAEPHGALKARSCFPPFPQNQLDRPGNLCRVGNFLDRLYAMASPRPIGGGHCGDFGV